MKPFIVPKDATSWVEVAPGSDFPIQNLPFAVVDHKGRGEGMVCAIGDFALDLTYLYEEGFIDEEEFPWLDSMAALDREMMTELRSRIFTLLSAENSELRDNAKHRKRALLPLAGLAFQVPIPPTTFVDFYSGIHHASNVGRMFRPDQPPLLPNYRHVPIGYNGRASSVVATGTNIIRPKGQTKAPDAEGPSFGPTAEMDFELEMGFYIGHGQEMGKRITCKAAEEHILGMVIVNDWSARDVQRWEYQPLGPFLSKSFATSVSPWLVTLDALEPFRIEGMEQDPEVLHHIRRQGQQHFDINLEVWLQSAKMKKPQRICVSNAKHLYWSMSQQLAHQTSNGTPVEFGDLYASGTISGPEEGSFGSMLELTWRGSKPLTLEETGETRTFLEDGDVLTMKAFAESDGLRIGFGACSGKILPAN
ncbi:MAG: fumarylacetoacetase [Armatimonadetes bacterium]|nr:fumarylacetoacetase [Armatimonadota bacterium]